jgi:hypothetical protein
MLLKVPFSAGEKGISKEEGTNSLCLLLSDVLI